MADSGYKNISRVDRTDKRGRETHGWLVRIGWMGVMYRKFFSDANFDDPLEEAIKWRDEKEREIGKPRTESWIRGFGRLKHQPSGKLIRWQHGKT